MLVGNTIKSLVSKNSTDLDGISSKLLKAISYKIERPLAHIFSLKVPKCENFHRTDFFNFYTIKPLWVGDFRVKIKNSKF